MEASWDGWASWLKSKVLSSTITLSKPLSTNIPKKILLVVLDNLGDAVLGTSLLPSLRQAYPEASFGLWVKEYAKETFDPEALFLKIHAADPFWGTAPGRGRGAFGKFWAVLQEIRLERYDLAFILNTEWRRALACWWAQIPNRVGFSQRKAAPFLTHRVSLPKEGGHVIEDHAYLLNTYLGERLPLEFFKPGVGLSQRQKENGKDWKGTLGWQDKTIVVLHPITGDRKKNWPLQRWAELLERLLEQFQSFHFAVLSSPQEEKLLREAFASFSPKRVQVAVGSISQVKFVLSQAHLFLGGDSGPAHIAAALGIPILSFFGPTDPKRYQPIGKALMKVIRCNPLVDLSVESVFEIVSNLNSEIYSASKLAK